MVALISIRWEGGVSNPNPFNLWHTNLWAQARPFSCLKSWDSNSCQLHIRFLSDPGVTKHWMGADEINTVFRLVSRPRCEWQTLVRLFSRFILSWIQHPRPLGNCALLTVPIILYKLCFSTMLIELPHVCLIFYSFCSFCTGCGCTPLGPTKLIFITVFYRSQMVYN